MSYALFINRNDIIKNSPLQGAIDADALLPFVRVSQDKYIKNLIGTVLFDYLQDQIIANTVSSLTVYYQDLLDDYIKNALIWYSCVEYIPFSSVQFKSNGAVKTKIIKQYIPVINKLVNKYLAAMDFFVAFELNENFEETIKSRHRDDFCYESFSEGEKMRIDLALLFTWRAVSKLRNSASTNLLIMDEVFDSSLDNNGTEEFLQRYNSTLPASQRTGANLFAALEGIVYTPVTFGGAFSNAGVTRSYPFSYTISSANSHLSIGRVCPLSIIA